MDLKEAAIAASCSKDAGTITEHPTGDPASTGTNTSTTTPTAAADELDPLPPTKSKLEPLDKTKLTEKKARANKKTKLKVSKICRTTSAVDHSDSDIGDDEVSSSSSSSGSSSESDSDSDSSDTERSRRRASRSKKHVAARKKRAKVKMPKKKSTKKSSKRRKQIDTSSDSDSTSDSDSSCRSESDNSDAYTNSEQGADGDNNSDMRVTMERLRLQVAQLQQQVSQSPVPHVNGPGGPAYGILPGAAPLGQPHNPHWNAPIMANPTMPPPIPNQMLGYRRPSSSFPPPPPPPQARSRRRFGGHTGARGVTVDDGGSSSTSEMASHRKKRGKKATIMDYKRVDSVWDPRNYTFKLKDTVDLPSDSSYEDYIFHVRRTFGPDGKFRSTFVDIKSKLLRECLKDVIGDINGVSLVEECPEINPNTLFLYSDELKEHLKHLKKCEPAGSNKKKKKKNKKRLENKRRQLKVLVKYLDKDYAKIKQSLFPMLENGLITFDLLWALWKPETLVYAPTHGNHEEPRLFKVEASHKQSHILKGSSYFVDGRVLEFDGKKFGYGDYFEEIADFEGAQKITNLPCYPLKYHKNEAQLRKDLVERGKKFVSLCGVHYKSYSGIAYAQIKDQMIKFNIQRSRVMVDPATFRRINPNYGAAKMRSRDDDTISDGQVSDDESDCGSANGSSSEGQTRLVTKVFKTPDGQVRVVRIAQDEAEGKQGMEELDPLETSTGNDASEPVNSDQECQFTDDEYLIASPVVLGFAFADKQWLELAVSCISEIEWNESAWDSLVLEPATKDLIQALVKSRKINASKTIDDVIQGKGKGLVTVLHGPPGTGKTLTAEGISELLKCPLYMASAGELGTESRFLEVGLKRILDICHTWGAILLLDEADVFLEQRDMHEIHRNALVSIFLRQLEYFQGILFLTTNRVETFDEAFQSRIHIALRYDKLDVKAKKSIFKMFLDKVRALGKIQIQEFTDEDVSVLARHDLNGREIKNVIGAAQDLAVSRDEALGLQHVQQVLDVHAKFGRDLKGGAGYEDAMRSYF